MRRAWPAALQVVASFPNGLCSEVSWGRLRVLFCATRGPGVRSRAIGAVARVAKPPEMVASCVV